MPRLTQARRQLREDELLGAARLEFARSGYEATSISGIARRANVSDGLIYRYFADKRALLAAVLEQYMGEIIAEAETVVFAERGFARRIEHLMIVQLRAFAEEPAICRLYIRQLRDASDYTGSPIHAQMRRYTALLLRIAEEAREAEEIGADIDPRLLRDLVFGGIEHIAWRHLANNDAFDVEGIAAQLARIISGGIVQGGTE